MIVCPVGLAISAFRALGFLPVGHCFVCHFGVLLWQFGACYSGLKVRLQSKLTLFCMPRKMLCRLCVNMLGCEHYLWHVCLSESNHHLSRTLNAQITRGCSTGGVSLKLSTLCFPAFMHGIQLNTTIFFSSCSCQADFFAVMFLVVYVGSYVHCWRCLLHVTVILLHLLSSCCKYNVISILIWG